MVTPVRGETFDQRIYDAVIWLIQLIQLIRCIQLIQLIQLIRCIQYIRRIALHVLLLVYHAIRIDLFR